MNKCSGIARIFHQVVLKEKKGLWTKMKKQLWTWGWFGRIATAAVAFILIWTVLGQESTAWADQRENPENVNITRASTLPTDHGALRVEGSNLVDSSGEMFQLYGMSTHGLAWFPQYITMETFRTLRDDWGSNCVRLALYTDEYNGYCNGGNQEELKRLVEHGVFCATELGMYVIVDWHVLNDKNPNVHKEEAKRFFDEMAAKWKDQNNVIYEICNEPNSGVTWEEIKSYADQIIPVIRKHDSDAVIIVGTPTWSQDIDQALNSPLAYDNIMYALHFYAGTHTDWLRHRAEECKKQGLPLFISEFGMCDASGNGANNFEQASKWMDLIETYHLSYCCWNLANKNETSSVLKPECAKVAGWEDTDLSEAGIWIRQQFKKEGQK